MNALFKIISWIIQQPLNKGCKYKAINRFIRWQFNTRINPYPIIMPWVNGSKLIVTKGMPGATGNLYAGLFEFEDMSFLLHFLRSDDTFMDIGSNIGSYTVLASGAIGTKSIAVEPIPTTFEYLQANVNVNNMRERVTPLNIGLGGTSSLLRFTKTQGATNHVAIEGEKDTIEVPVQTLDEVLQIRQCPSLIKIDVEGFETEVLQGGKETLSNPDLKAVIIELNGSGKRYGYEDKDIHKAFVSVGFQPYTYEPFSRYLIKLDTFSYELNTIYIRNLNFVQDRLQKAESFMILGRIV